MDDKVTIISEFGSDGKVRASKISIEKFEVEKMVRNFNLLLRYAKTLEDVIENVDK